MLCCTLMAWSGLTTASYEKAILSGLCIWASHPDGSGLGAAAESPGHTPVLARIVGI